jgi:hypothetical protein
MASEIKVNTIKRATGTTITVGESGDSVAVTGNIVKSNALQASDGGNIIDQCGTTVTLGATGDTIALACGASATGFGLSWCSSIKSTAFSASAGKGYFVNTCGGAFTVTLPATATAGDQISLKDYARTWGVACKAVTLDPQSLKYQGATCDVAYSNSGDSLNITYADASKGWLPTIESDTTNKQAYSVQYLVVAGGGGGGQTSGGMYGGAGGGGGGMRLVASKSLSVCKGATIPVTVGGGGAAGASTIGVQGASSIFSTITSAGGGYGAAGGPSPTPAPIRFGGDGGSGGGGGSFGGTAGSGNTPPSPCTQGKDGGAGHPGCGGGGGGGHSVAGEAGGTPGGCRGGDGGDGTVDGIRGTPFDPVAYAGGAGGSGYNVPQPTGGAGGGGSGGYRTPSSTPGTAGGANTGGGGGGGAIPSPASNAAAGGSGIVIIRRLTACSTSTSGTVTTCGSDTIHSFTGDGTFVA